MSRSLSFKDYQLLSAYMDGRTSTREKARVEAMLAADADFQTTYNEFSRLKRMMKAVPSVKAPRNFTLSATVAPQKPQRFLLAPALNYAALVTAILFVFLFAGSRFWGTSFAAKQAEAPQAMMLSASDESAAAESTLVPMITWGHVGGLGGRGGGAGGSGLGGGPSVAAAPDYGVEAVNPETMVQGTKSPTEGTQTPEPTGDISQLILGLPDESAQGKQLSESNTPIESQRVTVNWLLVGEIGLAVLAVGFAVAAFLLRKRH